MRLETSDGKFVTVDEEDYGWLSAYNWSISRKGYAVRYGYDGTGKYRQFWLHKEILRAEKGQIVDHINGDPTDNRRRNLRLATATENSRNRRIGKNSTGYVGVIAHRTKWRAFITAGTKRKTYLGVFDTPEEAAHARDEAVKRLHGKFGVLNFPEKKNDKGNQNSDGKVLPD